MTQRGANKNPKDENATNEYTMKNESNDQNRTLMVMVMMRMMMRMMKL